MRIAFKREFNDLALVQQLLPRVVLEPNQTVLQKEAYSYTV